MSPEFDEELGDDTVPARDGVFERGASSEARIFFSHSSLLL